MGQVRHLGKSQMLLLNSCSHMRNAFVEPWNDTWPSLPSFDSCWQVAGLGVDVNSNQHDPFSGHFPQHPLHTSTPHNPSKMYDSAISCNTRCCMMKCDISLRVASYWIRESAPKATRRFGEFCARGSAPRSRHQYNRTEQLRRDDKL